MTTTTCDSVSLDAVLADFLVERDQDPSLRPDRFALRLPGSLRRAFLDELRSLELVAALPGAQERREVAGYRLGACIGQGAAGRVFVAEQPELGRRVAIKMLHATALANDTQAVPRLRREARVLAALRHPSIVAVHDVVQIEGAPAIVMQLIAGRSLRALVQALCDPGHADHALARQLLAHPSRVAATFADLASALAHAHARGVVHRDVKPGNIVLDDDGHATLLDFGLARDDDVDGDDAARTAVGDVLGTPLYMAPEQLAGLPAGPAADIWALGSVLQECLTGRAASGPDAMLPRRVPAALRRLIRSCRQHEPGRRPSAAWLAERLRVVASRATSGAGTVPWSRRWLAAVAAGLVFVASAGAPVPPVRDRSVDGAASASTAARMVGPAVPVPS